MIDQQYPRMLYLDGDRSSTRIVNNPNEEEAARHEGYTRTPRPLCEDGFPKWMTERPISMGGWKQADLRRVQLNNTAEEQHFLALVEREDWIADYKNIWGGRGISVAELVRERKEMLKAIIDAEDLNET